MRHRPRVAELLLMLAEVRAAKGGLAPTLTYATSPRWVVWLRSGCRMAKDPGAQLVTA